jgi:hypothetical protein
MKLSNVFVKRFFLLLVSIVCIEGKGQYEVTNYQAVPELVNRVSISGIAILNNKLYMVAERCKKLFVSDLASHKIIDTLSLITGDDVEFEGLTVFKNELYTVSENNGKSYHINLSTGQLTELTFNFTFPPMHKGDGLEGIAGNSKLNLVYVLLERDARKENAVIYTFKVEPNTPSNQLQLNFQKNFSLALDSVELRYSDLAYDSLNNRLVVIRSFYKNKIGRYSIETIALDEQGLPMAAPVTLANLNEQDFTPLIKTYQSLNYDSNLEGIAIDKNQTIYIASDNAMGEADCEPNANKPAKKTLVLELIKK